MSSVANRRASKRAAVSVSRAAALRSPRPAERASAAYVVSAVDRALGLLETLAENPNVGVTRIAKLTGTTKTLAFRLLYTLERRGYVRKDAAARTYTLGFRPLLLGENTREQIDLIRLAQPHLDELVADTRENIYMTVRDGRRAVCVSARQSPQPLRLYADVGRSVPLHVGGGPKLLLAFAPPEIIQAVLAGPLKTFNPGTDTRPQALMSQLERIRRTGINESRGDLDVGAFSIAVPVRDHSSAVIAALSIAGPYARLNPTVAARYKALVREHAARLSQQLGWTEAI